MTQPPGNMRVPACPLPTARQLVDALAVLELADAPVVPEGYDPAAFLAGLLQSITVMWQAYLVGGVDEPARRSGQRLPINDFDAGMIAAHGGEPAGVLGALALTALGIESHAQALAAVVEPAVTHLAIAAGSAQVASRALAAAATIALLRDPEQDTDGLLAVVREQSEAMLTALNGLMARLDMAHTMHRLATDTDTAPEPGS